MKRGEVWWVEFDPAVGTEIRKTRPAVIISNDTANDNLARVVVIPLTSNTERLYPGEALVMINDSPGKVMSDQIMAADKKRLKQRVAMLTLLELKKIEKALALHLSIGS